MVLTFYNTGSLSIKLNKDLGNPVGSTFTAPTNRELYEMILALQSGT